MRRIQALAEKQVVAAWPAGSRTSPLIWSEAAIPLVSREPLIFKFGAKSSLFGRPEATAAAAGRSPFEKLAHSINLHGKWSHSRGSNSFGRPSRLID